MYVKNAVFARLKYQNINIAISSPLEPLLHQITIIRPDNRDLTFAPSELYATCMQRNTRYSRYNSVTYLSQESRRGISSLGVKLGLWFKSLARRLRGCEPPMLEVLNLPLLAECSLEDSLLAGPESETRRAVTEENRHEELNGGRDAQSTILGCPTVNTRCKIHFPQLSSKRVLQHCSPNTTMRNAVKFLQRQTILRPVLLPLEEEGEIECKI